MRNQMNYTATLSRNALSLSLSPSVVSTVPQMRLQTRRIVFQARNPPAVTRAKYLSAIFYHLSKIIQVLKESLILIKKIFNVDLNSYTSLLD
jgi:hypothetical protein